jgi:hypothetical protein
MKTYGKLLDYENGYGHILSVDGKEYIVLDRDILNLDLNKNDYVEFIAEQYNSVETNIDIARFVKKLDKNQNYETEKSSYIK